MVSSISSHNNWANIAAAAETQTTATVANSGTVKESVPATVDGLDYTTIGQSMTVAQDNSAVALPKVNSGALTPLSSDGDYDVLVNTNGVDDLLKELEIPSKLADLKTWDKFKELPKTEQSMILSAVTAGKGKAEVVTALANLIVNDDFKASANTTRATILTQCKNYADGAVIDNLGRMTGVDWFKEMEPADMQRAAKSIAYVTKHGEKSVNEEQKTLVTNTLNRLLSGEIKMDFHEFDDDPGTITYGHSHSNEKRISINNALVPAGDAKFPDNKADARHAVLATLAHEVSHSVNGDQNRATYQYFQAEYRAWFVGYIAEYGKHPTRQEAFDRCIQLFNLYPNIEAARTDTSWFGWTTSDDARKIIAFMDQFDNKVTLDVKDTASADAILAIKVSQPKQVAPLPDTSIKYDFDN